MKSNRGKYEDERYNLLENSLGVSHCGNLSVACIQRCFALLVVFPRLISKSPRAVASHRSPRLPGSISTLDL